LRKLAFSAQGKAVKDSMVGHFTGFDRWGGRTPEQACDGAVSPRATGVFAQMHLVHAEPICPQCNIQAHFYCVDETLNDKGALRGRKVSPLVTAPGAMELPSGNIVVPFEQVIRAAASEVGAQLDLLPLRDFNMKAAAAVSARKNEQTPLPWTMNSALSFSHNERSRKRRHANVLR
jgi:hypothetical protein